MQKRQSAALIVLGVIAVAATAAAAVLWSGGQPLAPATASSNVGEKRWLAVAPGRVEPRSGQIRVAAPIVGVVDRVLVKPNDAVFAGELLLQMKDDELAARVISAQVQVAVRKRARNDKAGSKDEERRKAEDSAAEAEQAVYDAQDAVDKAAAEARTTGKPNPALAAAREALKRAQEDFAKRKSLLQRVVTGSAPLPSTVDGQLIGARAELSIARAALEKLSLRAPLDGTVLQVNIHAGELAAPSAPQPLVLLADLTKLRVRAELDERDVAEIKLGQMASVRSAAMPGREFTGKVVSIAPMVEPARIGARGPNNRSDVDAVEVLIDLVEPGPLTVGMRVDVYFDREPPATQ